MNEQEFEYVQRLAVEEATDMVGDNRPERNDDSGWDKWHDEHFGRVLAEVDKGAYSYLEAVDISGVCSDVENDIRYSDILGL